MHNRINICFCVDNNYTNPLGALLCSLVASNGHRRIDIYIISYDLTSSSKARLKSIIGAIANFSLIFITSTNRDIQQLTTEKNFYVTPSTYIRFELADALPKLDKVLYLDADIIIAGDIQELWDTNIANHYIAAVENPFFDRHQSLGMDNSYGYFNAGVLLANLSLWRQDDIKKHAIAFMNTNSAACILFDQDTLNAVCKGLWIRLALRWNLQLIYLTRARELPHYKDEIRQTLANPTIIHYTTNSKPWHFFDPHPLKHLYKKYENKFSYRASTQQNKLIDIIKEPVRWLYYKIRFFYQLRI